MKKSVVSCWLLAAGVALATGVARAAETVTYWDSDAKKEKTQTACQAVTASTTTLKGWYFVEGRGACRWQAGFLLSHVEAVRAV